MRMIAPRTSATHPLRVDWLRTPGPERLGLTLAPGRQGGTVYGDAPWRRDLDEDLDRLVHHYRVARLVSLVPDRELAQYRIPRLLDAALAELAEVRSPNRPENDRQRAFIRHWARRPETGP